MTAPANRAPRIDSHQHLWRLARGDYGWLTPGLAPLYRDFTPADLAPLLAAGGIDATLLVQAAPTEAETRFLLETAAGTPFVAGVVELYRALETSDRDRAAAAYENWGFRNLSRELIDTLNVWARFIYAPMLDDRVRSVADGIRPGEYGRKEAFAVHKRLRELGPVTPPREFVFMDRAAIGLGAVFLHLGAELNFHRLFNEAIEAFDTATLDKRQSAALKKAGVPLVA